MTKARIAAVLTATGLMCFVVAAFINLGPIEGLLTLGGALIALGIGAWISDV